MNRKGKLVDKKHKNFISIEDRPAGTITVGTDNQSICVPANVTITVPGKLSRLVTKGSDMIKLAAHNNLPSGVVVNCSYVTPKAGQVVMILINTTNRNIWICQALLAAEICEVELHHWQYHSVLYREGIPSRLDFSQ